MLNNHWDILGGGAIGSLFAHYFRQANIHSTILGRPSTNNTPETNTPIHFTHLDGSSESLTLNVRPSNAENGTIKQLLLTTKAHQSIQAIQDIQSRVDYKAIIVVMQNGMGVSEELQKQFPQAQILPATTTEGANRPAPGSLIHAGSGETWIGSLSSSSSSQILAQAVAKQWEALALNIGYDADIAQRLWTKLAINCAINPLTVKFQCANGELLNKPAAMKLMNNICQELQAIMRCQGIGGHSDLFSTVKVVAEKTASNISSMLQDIQNQRPTEIHYINGYAVNAGYRLGVPTPYNQSLVDEIEKRTNATQA